jgi:hypothetical protein
MKKTAKNLQKIHKPHNTTIKKPYSEKDYQSNDGMLTSVWGPSAWHLLHTMSFNYPINPTKEDKKHYRNFVLSLKWTLPCGKCRKNLLKNFQKLPLEMRHMKSRATFSKYIYDLHELINTMLNKKSGLTYDMVRERYEHFRSRCTKSIKEMEDILKQHKIDLQEKQNVENEKGCVEPLYGEKSKCILKIVPQTEKCDTFQINDKCIKRKL